MSVDCFVSRYNIAAPVRSKCNTQSMKICIGFSWLGIVKTRSSERRTENFKVQRRSENFDLYDQQLPQAPKSCITHQLQQRRTLFADQLMDETQTVDKTNSRTFYYSNMFRKCLDPKGSLSR